MTEIAVRGLMERKAIENSRKATLPAKPEDYKGRIGDQEAFSRMLRARVVRAVPEKAPILIGTVHRWADDLDESRSGWNGSHATQKKAC